MAAELPRDQAQFLDVLRGFLGALEPGGVLVFMGAEQDSPSDAESRRKLFEETWLKQPRFSIAWSHEHGGVRCTCIIVREKGDMFIDEHHIFLIEENGKQRIETATVRQAVYWSWATLKELFAQAGFSRLETRSFRGISTDGGAINLNVATK